MFVFSKKKKRKKEILLKSDLQFSIAKKMIHEGSLPPWVELGPYNRSLSHKDTARRSWPLKA